jgi:hypothetical protein
MVIARPSHVVFHAESPWRLFEAVCDVVLFSQGGAVQGWKGECSREFLGMKGLTSKGDLGLGCGRKA